MRLFYPLGQRVTAQVKHSCRAVRQELSARIAGLQSRVESYDRAGVSADCPEKKSLCVYGRCLTCMCPIRRIRRPLKAFRPFPTTG